jgi:hypothetical protein
MEQLKSSCSTLSSDQMEIFKSSFLSLCSRFDEVNL